MAEMLEPLHDRVVIKPFEVDGQTDGGLYIPDNAKQDRPQRGTVMAVGPGARRETDGERIPMDVKEGDVVVYGKYAGSDLPVGRNTLIVLKEAEIIGILRQVDESI